MKKWLLLPVLIVLLCGCQRQSAPIAAGAESPAAVRAGAAAPCVGGEELLALAQSEEEAKSIAERYGIELVEFSYGVATFHTEEDPGEVIRRGKEQGWPELGLNRIQTLTDPDTATPERTG